MKRITILISMIVVMVALAACGGAPAPAAVNEETAVIDVTTLPEQIDVETAVALLGRDDVVLIDVREQWEYDEGHIPGITLIP
ncbi:MAG: rhodanese-like domain-containing protein, partial [Anaerolineales bacterium]|nr:rhodanese-like domain-containing protein [Anaerolineales bacterium]